MASGERRLSAIMFTDVVGFTTLGQANEELALQLLEEHRGVVRPIITRHGGVEVKTIGDAFLVEYASALEAVKGAVEIQRAMHDRNATLSEERRVLLRIGIHVGDVVHAKGDILGRRRQRLLRGLSRWLPLAVFAYPTQIYDHVRNKMSVSFEKVEGKTLKNVSIPIDVYRIVMPWESREEQEVRHDSKRIAVLPLKNMSPDPNDEYFADGMTEELITSLSFVKELTVIARTSVMQYKNSTKRIADIGKELGVGTLIEGSVRKAANKVRITIQLIDARNEGHLWAQSYDKQLDDVFMVQSEVAQKVADALKVTLLETQVRRLERGASKNPEAFNTYLKGMFYWSKRTPAGLRKAAELFEESITLDPIFALGYAGVAQAFQVTAANHYEDPEVFYPKSKEFALKALSLDDDLAEAHAVLASCALGWDRDIDKCESEFKRAIELNPNYPTAHQWYAHLLLWEKRTDEAWREISRALELSPLSMIINANVADYYILTGNYEKGIEQVKKVIEMDPTFGTIYVSAVRGYVSTVEARRGHRGRGNHVQIDGTEGGDSLQGVCLCICREERGGHAVARRGRGRVPEGNGHPHGDFTDLVWFGGL